MDLFEIKQQIEHVVKHFSENVHVSGKDNAVNYAAGIGFLENLAAAIDVPPEKVKQDE